MYCKNCGKKLIAWQKKFCGMDCYHKSTRGMVSPNHHRKGMVIGRPIGSIIRARGENYLRIKVGCMKWKRHHRWVMEQYLKRELLPTEHIHHKNGDRFDNRIENLMVLSNSEHGKIHQALLRGQVMPI